MKAPGNVFQQRGIVDFDDIVRNHDEQIIVEGEQQAGMTFREMLNAD